MVRKLIAVALCACCLSCGASTPTTNPVEGLITRADADEVVVRTDEGATYTFRNADKGVALSHLREHQRGRLPVSVTWEDADGTLQARIIGDAP